MATFIKFQDFSEQLARGVHDAIKTDLAEIAAGNDYTALSVRLTSL